MSTIARTFAGRLVISVFVLVWLTSAPARTGMFDDLARPHVEFATLWMCLRSVRLPADVNLVIGHGS